jgi:hypothetical protein
MADGMRAGWCKAKGGKMVTVFAWGFVPGKTGGIFTSELL